MTDQKIEKIDGMFIGAGNMELEIKDWGDSKNYLPKFQFALREDLKQEKQFLPNKVDQYATGYDVRAAQSDKKDIVLKAGQIYKIPLGFRCTPNSGYYFELHPRSSSFVRSYMHTLIGIIDENYSKEVLLAFHYLPDINSMGKDVIIKWGERIGQIIPRKIENIIVEDISNEDYDRLYSEKYKILRGGFGSSGK